MKFLCLGYFDPAKMDARPNTEIDALMGECRPHMEALYETAQVVIDAGLDLETKSLRRVNGKVTATDGPLSDATLTIGSALLIEARDMEDAIRVASLHPSTQVAAGEQFGWATEIRPIHYFWEGDQSTV